MMYRTHCQRIVDTVVRTNFDDVSDCTVHGLLLSCGQAYTVPLVTPPLTPPTVPPPGPTPRFRSS